MIASSTLSSHIFLHIANVPIHRPKLWRGRRVFFHQWHWITMPDTPDDQREFPQPSSQQEGFDFAETRIVGLSCAATGAIIAALIAPANGKATGKLSQMRTLAGSLTAGRCTGRRCNQQNLLNVFELEVRYLRTQTHAGLDDSVGTMRDLEAVEGHINILHDLIPGETELDTIVARLAEYKAAGPESNETAKKICINSTEAALAKTSDLWNKGSRDDAATLLEQWFEGNPSDLSEQLTLASTYASMKRIDDAIIKYEMLLEGNMKLLVEEAQLSALNNLAWYL